MEDYTVLHLVGGFGPPFSRLVKVPGSYLLADHHGRGHVSGGAANNAQLIKSEDEEEAHQTSDGPLSAAAARQKHIARRAKNPPLTRCSVNSLLPHCICNKYNSSEFFLLIFFFQKMDFSYLK